MTMIMKSDDVEDLVVSCATDIVEVTGQPHQRQPSWKPVVAAGVAEADCHRKTSAMDGSDDAACGMSKCAQNTLDPVLCF